MNITVCAMLMVIMGHFIYCCEQQQLSTIPSQASLDLQMRGSQSSFSTDLPESSRFVTTHEQHSSQDTSNSCCFLAEVYSVTAEGHWAKCVYDARTFNKKFLGTCYESTQLEFVDTAEDDHANGVVWYQLNEENLKRLALGSIPYSIEQSSRTFKVAQIDYYRVTTHPQRRLSVDHIATLHLF